MERHFCVTVYVIDPNRKEFLFIKHKKLGKWIAPRGHIEENELPDEAALREIREETGIDVQLIGERRPRNTDLICPFAIQHNVLEKGKHEHMDLVYIAVPLQGQVEKINEEETEGLQWFSLDEICNDSFQTFDKVKGICTTVCNMNFDQYK